MALFLFFSCFWRPLPVFASFLALSSGGTFARCACLFFLRRLFRRFCEALAQRSTRVDSRRRLRFVFVAQKSIAEIFRGRTSTAAS